MNLRPISAAVLLALSALTVNAAADDIRRPYIIQLADKPVASYNGEIEGMPATQPAPGERLDLASQPVQVYSNYLGQKQSEVVNSVPSATVLHNYSYVLNGFAAMLTDDEVRQLMARSDVASVTADEPRQISTTYTAAFLGLDKPDGLWSKLVVNGKQAAGEGIIIGIVDGGVWPENLSYADRVDANGKPTHDPSGTLVYDAPPARWKGTCQTGEGFTVAHCNNKLIGAQFFDATYRTTGNVTHWSEFRSPRDSIGGGLGEGSHGTHTSSTAGGNAGADAVINGINLGPASGMAPRARIATYKVCWSYNDATRATGARNSCYVGDSVAAIDKAVADGVHVLNFSISGGATVTDAVEQAFYNASNAGVFVAASAGNDGPGNAVAHISPWQTTVGASTHNRELQAEVVLGNGQRFLGASMNTAPLPDAPLIRAEDAGFAGADPTRLSLCFSDADGGPAVLDPAKVTGKIVICTRNVNARVDKSLAVLKAGGVGMVMVDNGLGLIGEVHSVPTVHVTVADGATIQAYAQTPGSTASMTKFKVGSSAVKAPVMADFSSRGPNRYDANVLKPDLTAPGVDIIAGATPRLTQSQRADVVTGALVPPTAWTTMQGTSMSSPHVAGLAALLKQLYPNWTPAMIKSALMTTGSMTFPDAIASGDTRGILPFGQGAGHVTPNRAADPGLVYDLSKTDYQKYMCGVGVTTHCSVGTIPGYNLNLPSIAVGNMLGSVPVTVTRTVKNVGAPGTYTPKVNMTGFSAVVSPSSLTFTGNESKSYTVTLTRTSAVDNVWYYGDLTWSDGTRSVRSPIVARAGAPVVAPLRILSDRVSMSKPMTVSTGFTGKMTAAFGGLKEITRTAYTIAQAPAGTVDDAPEAEAACRAGGPGTVVVPFTVTPTTLLAQFELFNRDTSSGTSKDDLDLAILDATGKLVAYTNFAGSNELIELKGAPAGNYKACVLAWQSANGTSTDFTLSSALVTSADRGGNFRVILPAKVYAGSTASVSTSWSGLAPGKRYAGAVQLLDQNGAPAATTVVRVETNAPVPLAEPVNRATPADNGL